MASLISQTALEKEPPISLAPMVDFLFLLLAIFATLTMVRNEVVDDNINLVHIHQQTPVLTHPEGIKTISLSVDESGTYRWFSQLTSYTIADVPTLQRELLELQNSGIIDQDASKTAILIQIDAKAAWESIAKLVYGLRQMGFEPHPVYESSTP